ncbi:unnamed protein product, partial [Rotaria sp. Silwood2]
MYQKLQVLTLLQAGFTYENIRNQVGVSNGYISRKKLTTSNEDRYLLKLMKKDRGKSSRKLAFEWNLSNGKSISPQTVRRRLLN